MTLSLQVECMLVWTVSIDQHKSLIPKTQRLQLQCLANLITHRLLAISDMALTEPTIDTRPVLVIEMFMLGMDSVDDLNLIEPLLSVASESANSTGAVVDQEAHRSTFLPSYYTATRRRTQLSTR